MNNGWWVLGAALVAAAFVSSGLYSIAPVSQGERPGYVAVINRFTGSAWFCIPSECRPMPANSSSMPAH
jgi:hypothetical protein